MTKTVSLGAYEPMKIEWFSLCRDGYLEPETTLHGIGIDGIYISTFPREVTITLAIQFRIPWADLLAGTGQDILKIEVRDPEMNTVVSVKKGVGVTGVNPMHPDGWDGYHMSVLALTFEAESEGTHLIAVGLTEGAPRTLPLNLRATNPGDI